MASELDDFFAKKDKKKKKTKGKKFVTTEEIVKTIDTTESEAADNTVGALEKTASSHTKVSLLTWPMLNNRLLDRTLLSDRPSVPCSTLWRVLNKPAIRHAWAVQADFLVTLCVIGRNCTVWCVCGGGGGGGG